MDYSKFLFRLVYEVPQNGKKPKEIPILPQAYAEHRFSDYFIYGYRDDYVDVYSKESCMLILEEHTFSEVIEYHYQQHKWLIVRQGNFWGAYDFTGNLVCNVELESQNDVISSLQLSIS